jgi:hypothetical protein
MKNPLESILQIMQRRGIVAPLLVAAALRFALMCASFARSGTHIMTQGDTASYLEPGLNLLKYGLFASGGLPEIDRTPGYPIFVMLSGMLFGNVLLSVMIQIIASLASLLLVRRIADMTFPHRNAGIVAAWFFAIEPVSILYTSRLMPETLFTLLLLVVIERLLSFYSTSRLGSVVMAGLALAAATYVKPASYYLVFALGAGLAITAGKRYRWKAPATLLLSVLPWFGLWQLRNAAETGYSGFSSIVGKNLYFFQSAEVTAELNHISLIEEQKRLGYADSSSYLAIHPEQRQWSRTQQLLYMRTQAMQILQAHRELYLKTHIAGVGVVAFTPCATELLQLLNLYPAEIDVPRRILNEGITTSVRRLIAAQPAVAATMAILEIGLMLLYGFAIRGCLIGKGVRVAVLTITGVALYFLLISGGAQAVGRYRLPIMPNLCILAAGGLTASKKKPPQSHHSPAEVIH